MDEGEEADDAADASTPVPWHGLDATIAEFNADPARFRRENPPAIVVKVMAILAERADTWAPWPPLEIKACREWVEGLAAFVRASDVRPIDLPPPILFFMIYHLTSEKRGAKGTFEDMLETLEELARDDREKEQARQRASPSACSQGLATTPVLRGIG